MKMLGDNETNFILTKDFKSRNCTKHINVMHHYVRRMIEDREISIKQILNSDILTNNLIKTFTVRKRN